MEYNKTHKIEIKGEKHIEMNEIINIGIDFSKKKKIEIIRDVLIFFLTFCIIGWIYEEIVFIIEENMLVNRGVLFGPWLPIYGIGGLFILLLFFKTKDKKINIGKVNIRPLIIYIQSTILSTALELITTYIIDFTGGNFKTLWDYSEKNMNFEGRIALIPDAKFGIIALMAIYVVQPILKKIISNKNQKILNIISIILTILFCIDLISRIWLGSNYVG